MQHLSHFFVNLLRVILIALTFYTATTNAVQTTTAPTASTEPLLTVNNNMPYNPASPLALICGTASKPGYLKHVFVGTDPNAVKTFVVNSGLFIDMNQQVVCSLYKIGGLTPYPHDFSLLVSFVLVPGLVGDQVKVKSYIEQSSSFEVSTKYDLNPTQGTLVFTLSANPLPKRDINQPPLPNFN